MNLKKVIILLTLSSLALSSCGTAEKAAAKAEASDNSNKQENGEGTTPSGTASFPKSFNETINDVAFQAEVDFPEEIETQEITGGTATKEIPDIDKVIGIFAEGKEPSTVYEDEASGENGETYPTYFAEYPDGSYLSADTMTIYSTSFSTQISDTFRLEDTSDYNADKYSMDKTFSFEKPEDAFSKIKDAITSCGYEISDCSYDYFALDAATMEKEERVYEKGSDQLEESTSQWDSSYDCYKFYAQQIFEGIPIFNGTQDFPDDSLSNRSIQAVYSKDGIQELYLDSIYQCSKGTDPIHFSEFEDIAKTIADKYGNILTDASYRVTRAQLYFMPHRQSGKEYDLIPIWLFEIKESGKDSETGEDFENTLYSFVNAQSGEEVTF